MNLESSPPLERKVEVCSDLLAAAEAAVLFLDLELRIVCFTPAAGELLGSRVGDRGRPVSELTHRPCLEDMVQDARSVLAKQPSVEREVRTESGGWYFRRVFPYVDDRDRDTGVAVTFVEITRWKDAEEALRQSEARLRAMVSVRHVGILTFDRQGRILHANDAFLDMFGYGREEFEAKTFTWRDFTPAEFVEASEKQIVQLEKTGHIGPYEKQYLRKGGLRKWMMFVGAKMGDGAILEYAIDISDRKMAEEALRASEERFRAMAELVPDLLWCSDSSGYTTWCNTRWVEYTRCRLDQLEGGGLLETIHPEDRDHAEQTYAAAVETEEALDQEYRIRRHDGAYRWFLVRAVPVRDDAGKVQHWFASATDVHEQRAALELLEKRVSVRTQQVKNLARRLTLAEQEERRRLAQILHDDLQQVLYGVRMKLEKLSHGIVAADEQLTGDLHKLRHWLDRAVSTTRQLTIELNPPILHGEGLADALQWLKKLMRDLHEFEVELETEDCWCIRDDGLQVLLFRIVRELLFNVVKHAGVGRATVRLAEVDGHFVIHVIDDGRGFDVKKAAAFDEEGRSFGLYHVRERIELLGGRCAIHSCPGGGTHVELRIPIQLLSDDRNRTSAGDRAVQASATI